MNKKYKKLKICNICKNKEMSENEFRIVLNDTE